MCGPWNYSVANYDLIDLLVSVSFPYVDTGQVSYDVCPQFLVCGELEHKKHTDIFQTRWDSSYRTEQSKRATVLCIILKYMEKKQNSTHSQGCGKLCLCIIHTVHWDTIQTLGYETSREILRTKSHTYKILKKQNKQKYTITMFGKMKWHLFII